MNIELRNILRVFVMFILLYDMVILIVLCLRFLSQCTGVQEGADQMLSVKTANIAPVNRDTVLTR